jgi:putative restriction endonuclease
MATGRPWTRDELLLAINLYCKTPFGRIHIHNPDIMALARKLDRTPGSVSYKMANLAALDESLDRKGAENYSKLDEAVWHEFFSNPEELVYQTEMKLDEKTAEEVPVPEGKERVAEVKLRVNQGFFRKSVLTAYNSACCVTGLTEPSLLVASHIIPWAENKNLRLNIRNGLCLNALHDRAFDAGFMTLDADYSVKYSKAVRDMKSEAARDMLLRYEGKPIILPDRFRPNQDYLAWHREHIFLN